MNGHLHMTKKKKKCITLYGNRCATTSHLSECLFGFPVMCGNRKKLNQGNVDSFWLSRTFHRISAHLNYLITATESVIENNYRPAAKAEQLGVKVSAALLDFHPKGNYIIACPAPREIKNLPL